MKKTMMMIAIAALAAGSAFAEEGNDEGQGCPQGHKAWSHEGGGKQAWGQRDERGNQDRERSERQEWGQDKRGGERPGGPMSPEMMDQMRKDHKAIRELGEAARAETDEAKKAELVSQLRVKLGEVADRMQAHQEQRLDQAEERLADLKAKIEEGKANRDSRIEEQVQRILSGERPSHPAAFDRFPNAKGGMRGGHGDWSRDELAPPPGAEGDELAPPPPEDMPEDMPPPPAE